MTGTELATMIERLGFEADTMEVVIETPHADPGSRQPVESVSIEADNPLSVIVIS